MFLPIKLCTYTKLNCLNRTVYMYKKDLALNNQQWLMCNKTKPNKRVQTWVALLLSLPD